MSLYKSAAFLRKLGGKKGDNFIKFFLIFRGNSLTICCNFIKYKDTYQILSLKVQQYPNK